MKQKKNKPILLKDFVIGILEYPLFLMGSSFWNVLIGLFFIPIYLSYLRIKGIDVFCNIDPSWNYGQIKDYISSSVNAQAKEDGK